MDNPGAMLVSLITVGVVNLLMFPILAALIKRGIMKKLDAMDEKREIARRQTEDEARDSKLWRAAIEDGVKSLLRAELLHENNKWTRKGYCPFESKQYLERLHNAYKGVGGNSIGDKLYEACIALPNSTEEE